MMLVGTVFLVQNNFYSHVLLRSQVQENARAVNAVLGNELRAIASGGILAAAADSIVLRYPMAVAFVCGAQNPTHVVVHIPGGVAGMDTSEVAGYGYRDPADGSWTYYTHSWSDIRVSGNQQVQRCISRGADTTGIATEFRRFSQIENDTGIDNDDLAAGETALLFYRKTTYRFASSTLITGDRALYRRVNSGTAVELATGLSSAASFQYRRGSTWYNSVSAVDLGTIDAVRVTIQSQGKGSTSSEATYDFGWTVDIPLVNAD